MEETVSPQEPVVDATQDTVEPETTEPQKTTEPTQPEYMTPEQVAEAVSRGNQELKTWIGRRDKDLFSQIGSVIDERLASATPVDKEALSSELLTDPEGTITKIVNDANARKSHQVQQHHNDAFTHIGNMMDTDPLYKDKDLGNELIEEIKKQYKEGQLDVSLPPKAAATVLHANALANVMRNRRKANPLSKNKPTEQIGSLEPGGPSKKVTPKMPKLNEDTLMWAKKWGYSDEDLIKLYGSESKK